MQMEEIRKLLKEQMKVDDESNEYSTEFISAVEDNGTIRVPEQYLHDISSPVRVIVFTDDEIQGGNEKKRFSAMKIKTKGFRFDRNEANER